MRTDIREKIFVLLYEKGEKGLTEPEIISFIGKKKDNKIISRELEDMKRFKVLNYSKLRYSLKNPDKFYLGTVTRCARGHGFVKLENCRNEEEDGEEVFIRGKDFHGAVPGDRVLVKIIADKDEYNRSRTAVVTSVLEFSSNMLTGVVVDYNGEIRLQPSSFSSPVPLAIVGFGEQAVRVGDKVRFEIKRRGERHSEHVATVT